MTLTAPLESVTDGGASIKIRRGKNKRKEKRNPRIATRGEPAILDSSGVDERT
jgi:hypothetical protein